MHPRYSHSPQTSGFFASRACFSIERPHRIQVASLYRDRKYPVRAIALNRKFFLVLTFSVVANGSSLAYAKKRGRISLTFASRSPLRLAHLCVSLTFATLR